MKFFRLLLLFSLFAPTVFSQVIIRERVTLNPNRFQKPTLSLLTEPVLFVDSTFYGPDLKMILALTDQPLTVNYSITASLSSAFPSGGSFYVQDAPWRTLSPVRYQFFIGSGGSGTFTGSFVQNVYYNLVGFVFNSPAGIYNATNVTVNASGDTATIGFKVNDAGFTSISAVFTMTLPSQNHVDHFAITSNPDTIKFGETSVLKIQAKDAANNDTDPPAGTKANIVLNVDEQYGNLEYNGIVGKAITNIPYEDARDGKVIFSAKTKNPLGLDPQQVPIGFTTVPAQYEGSTTVVVKPTIQKFCQQDGRWVGQNYDSYKQLDDKGKVKQPERQFTIGDKGCALSCMAMVLNAVGLNYTPLSLNEAMTKDSLFMKNNKGNWNGGVNWRAVAKYASSKLQPPQVLGSDLNWTNKTHLNLTDIDNRIQDKDFILALVGNPNRGDTTKLENHWVLITDKADGKYQILDPGRCDNSRPTLDSYSNKIYKVIIYKRKP